MKKEKFPLYPPFGKGGKVSEEEIVKFSSFPPSLKGGIKGGLLLLFIFLLSCSSRDPAATVIAETGSYKLTRGDIEIMAGLPWDSIAQDQRWTLLHSWIERALIEQEAMREGFDRDPKLQARLNDIRAELLRAKLMETRAIPAPDDAEIEAYYQSRAKEFQRAMDSYLIEVFWAENPEDISKLSLALTLGDSSLLESGEVQAEGRWLAGANELDNQTVVELAGLKSGEFGQPRIFEEGYRIVRLVEFYPAGTELSLSAVKEEIKMRIMIEKSRERDDALMNDLRSSYPVSIYMENSE